MLSKKDAQTLVEQILKDQSVDSDVDPVIVDAYTEEHDFGWVFFYQDRAFWDGDNSKMLGGNAPLIVDKRDSTVHVTGTAHSVEHYIDNYERYGTPHPPETAQEHPPSAQ